MNSQKSIGLILSLIACFSCILAPKKVRAIPTVILEENYHINPDIGSISDRWTQYFFDLIRPELINKKLKNSDSLYRREQAGISEIVNYVLDYTCQQSDQNKYYILTTKNNSNSSKKRSSYRYYSRRNNRAYPHPDRRSTFNQNHQQDSISDNKKITERNFFWQLNRDYFFDGLYQDLTDAIFYARHPEISHKENELEHLDWAAERNFIRRRLANYNQKEILQEDFIPVCQNNLN